MLLDWLAFPLLVIALSTGVGLLVARAAGWRLPGPVVPGVGLAGIIVAASLLTEFQATSRATPWVLVGLALLGGALWLPEVPRLRTLRPDPWAIAVFVLAFLAFAAPVLAYGHPTFLGYGVDGDPAFHFLYARELIEHGHRSVNLLPFRFSATGLLRGSYLATAYPFGGDVAIGALRVLVGTDVPWIYDPFIAVALGFGALALYELLRDAVASTPLRALCAFIAAQAGLTYSFFLISSIKELLTTWLITLLVVLGARILRRPPSARALFPFLVVIAAELYALAIPSIAWLGVPLLVFVVLALARVRSHLRRPSPRRVGEVVVVVVVGVAIAWPVLRSAATSFDVTTGVLGTAGSGASIGNLLRPLSLWQIMGIWPNGDYREPITVNVTLVYVLLWLAAASAVLGALWTIRRRAWGPLVLLLGNGIGALVLLEQSTPYGASKVEAILSVTAVLAAMLGAVALSDLVRPWLGWILAAVLAIAVLWTNSKSFRQAPVAPASRFAQLSAINARFHGEGPTYYDMWDFEWPAYFLRSMGPYLPHLYGDPTAPAATGPRSLPQLQYPWDLADVTYAFQRAYRIMVIGRSPLATRPPANYALVDQTSDYDVYRRTEAPTVLRHVVVSDAADAPLYRPRHVGCATILHLAARARARHAHLVAAISPVVSSVKATQSLHPGSWVPLPTVDEPIPDGLTLYPTPGTMSAVVHVPAAGRYTVWLQGLLTQKVTLSVGGRTVGSLAQRIGPASQFTDMGSVSLAAGRQPVILRRSPASSFVPTNPFDRLGEVALTRDGGPPSLETVAPSAAETLCGARLQWIEIVR